MKPTTRARSSLFAAIAASITAFTGLARAENPPASAPAQTAATSNEAEGSEHFQRGVEYTKDNDFRAALLEFRRAYELAPNYRVLFNIGQVAFELQDYGQALDAFEQYLAEGGSAIPPNRRSIAENEVKRLKARVATVTVKVNIPDASILVDDAVVGKAPLARPLRIGIGRHKFAATAPNHIPAQRVVDLGGGEQKTVEFELRPPTVTGGASEPLPESTATTEKPASSSKTPLWIGIGVTGALAIGATVFGIVTLSNDKAFDDEVNRFVPSGNRDRIESARSSAQTTALVFDILSIATLVAGGTTLVIGLASSGGEHGKTAASARRFDLNRFTF